MFGNSRTSRPLAALVALMALSLGGCAHDQPLSNDFDLIGSIMAILDGLSMPPPSDSEEPIIIEGGERISLQAGGAMHVLTKADGTLETYIFRNTEDRGPAPLLSLAEFIRHDQLEEVGFYTYFDWGDPVMEIEKVISFDHMFGPGDLDPDQSGPFKSYSRAGETFSVVEPGEAILGLEYATFGGWSSDTVDELQVGFFFSGLSTEAESMPTTGSASYAGLTIGTVFDADNNQSALAGDMALSVNFADGSVDGDFTSMMKTSADGNVTPWRDFTMAASINAGTDNFTGTTITNDGLLSGQAEGAFFGPSAAEVAGAWTLSGNGEVALGSFAGGQN